MASDAQQLPSSYRDPSGFMFRRNGILFRQVNRSYQPAFVHLMNSGLYDELIAEGLMIPFEQTSQAPLSDDGFLVIRPEEIPFVSYPSEWCFDMLKDAALVTLKIQEKALAKGMILKDASAFNIQWYRGKLCLIDSLSFDLYKPENTWAAYRQFCSFFIAPLALMHYTRQPMQQMLLAYPEGIPIDLAASLLPWKSRFHLHTYLHLHLHARKFSQTTGATHTASPNFSAVKMKNLMRSLESAVQHYQLDARSGTWSGYYEEASERSGYLEEKKERVAQMMEGLEFQTVLDAGANEGLFSELAAASGAFVISTDGDHYSINTLYKKQRQTKSTILPLVMDLANPTPAFGLNSMERDSFLQRSSQDLVLALALIHHLAIGRNVPFARLAMLFLKAGRLLLIEWVPKTDPKVRLMLRHREDVFTQYSEENFLAAFEEHYAVLSRQEVGNPKRVLYLMKPHEREPH